MVHILAAANVGRSTFYEHYKSKDHLLNESLQAPLSQLANAIVPDWPCLEIEGVLRHFLENKAFSRTMLNGSTKRQILETLEKLFYENFVQLRLRAEDYAIPLKTVASACAGAQLAPVITWINDVEYCDIGKLAQFLLEVPQNVVKGARRSL